jgi:osmotically-inducible protein OsmY
MQKYNLGHKDAIAHVEKVDEERREWTRFLFGVDWHDPRLYDIVLNLSRMSLATACETVATLTERDEFKPTAASVKAMQDLTLQSRVSAALAMDFRTRDANLSVTADGGIVTITGTTRWPEVVGAVPAVVRQVDGVKEVRSEITGAAPPSPLTWY